MKLIIIFILSIFSTSLFGQQNQKSSIPFTVEKNCIYFYCKVNENDSIKFLFDTGADMSVISKKAVSNLKLKVDGKLLNQGSNGTNEIETSSKNNIQIGKTIKTDILFAIIPFGTDAFEGIIGTDLMQDNIIEIDYDEKMIHFYDKNNEDIDYDGYTKMELSTKNYPTLVKSTIVVGTKKYKALFGLDTGADDALTLASPFAKNNNFIKKMKKIGSAGFQGSDGSEYEMPIVLCPEIEFAEKHLYRIPAALSSATEGIDATDKFAGFYGNSFLKKFNIILDYESENIYFKLNKNLYKEYYE